MTFGARKCRPGAAVDAVVPDRTINLTFHGIGRPPRALEPGEGDVWMSREQFLLVLDAIEGRDDVRITFDDGNASDVAEALPALTRRGLEATFFVVAGRLGAQHFIGASEVRELAAAGMRIGSHGMRHRRWRGLDDASLREEHVQAKGILEEVVGRPVTEAACPFGAYDRRTLRSLRRAGYRHVYTSDRGRARAHDFLQARTSLGPHDGPGLLDQLDAPRALLGSAKLAVKRWR